MSTMTMLEDWMIFVLSAVSARFPYIPITIRQLTCVRECPNPFRSGQGSGAAGGSPVFLYPVRKYGYSPFCGYDISGVSYSWRKGFGGRSGLYPVQQRKYAAVSCETEADRQGGERESQITAAGTQSVGSKRWKSGIKSVIIGKE